MASAMAHDCSTSGGGANNQDGKSTSNQGGNQGGNQGINIMVGFFSLEAMHAISVTISGVPMLCILITFTRIRAVVDLHTAPQAYARGSFIATALCVYTQALAVVFLRSSSRGCLYWTGKVLDWLATLIMYLGITCIIVSICTLERCADPENKNQVYMCELNKIGFKEESQHVLVHSSRHAL